MKSRTPNFSVAVAALLGSCGAGASIAGELAANAAVTNNYIWRGLTQTENAAAAQGGIDYTADNGFYAGTWVSNVSYVPADPFSYEHDVYLGFRGGETVTWDVGYLYYNYDSAANYDFSEAYVALGWQGLTLKYSTLVQSGRDEDLDTGTRGVGPDVDYGFGSASYISSTTALRCRTRSRWASRRPPRWRLRALVQRVHHRRLRRLQRLREQGRLQVHDHGHQPGQGRPVRQLHDGRLRRLRAGRILDPAEQQQRGEVRPQLHDGDRPLIAGRPVRRCRAPGRAGTRR
jgi:hypothetical protein